MGTGSQEARGLRVGVGLSALSCLAPEEISFNFHPCSESGLVGSPWVDHGEGSRLVRILLLVRTPLPSPLMSLFCPPCHASCSHHLVARVYESKAEFRSALQHEKEGYTIYKTQVGCGGDWGCNWACASGSPDPFLPVRLSPL